MGLIIPVSGDIFSTCILYILCTYEWVGGGEVGVGWGVGGGGAGGGGGGGE